MPDSSAVRPSQLESSDSRNVMSEPSGIRNHGGGITLGKMFGAFKHRWLLATAVGLLLALGGASLAFLTVETKYTANAWLRVLPSELLLGAGPDAGRHREELKKTYAQLVKGRSAIKAALSTDRTRGLNVNREQIDPVTWVEKRLQAGFSGSELLRVSLSGANPDEITLILNALKDEFRKSVNANEIRTQKKRLADIEQVQISLQKTLDDNTRSMEQLVGLTKVKATDLATLATLHERLKVALEEVNSMRQELARLNQEVRRESATIDVLKAEVSPTNSLKIADGLLDLALDAHPLVAIKKDEVMRQEKRIEEYKKFFREDGGKLPQFKEELRLAKDSLEAARKEHRANVEKALREGRQKDAANNLGKAQDRLKVLLNQQIAAQTEVEQLGRTADLLTNFASKFESMKSEIEQTKQVMIKLRTERERLKVEVGVERETVEDLQPDGVEVPMLNESSVIRTAIGYSVVGLLLGILGVSFVEARSRRVLCASEITTDLGIDVLGVVPLVSQMAVGQKDKTVGGKSFAQVQGHVMTESFDHLLSTLSCDDRFSSKSIIMITSGAEKEGKTFLSTHMAATLARRGHKTLLLDCDLRRPNCHRVFSMPQEPGLAEVLRGETLWNDAVRPSPIPDLSVLSAGLPNQAIAQCLNNGTFSKLLTQLRHEFDYVIVDSGPILAVADSTLIGKHVDAVLLVIRSKQSRSPMVQAAFKHMRGLNIQVLGAIVNGVDLKMGNSYYYSASYLT